MPPPVALSILVQGRPIEAEGLFVDLWDLGEDGIEDAIREAPLFVGGDGMEDEPDA